MKILITGPDGFVGTSVCRGLVQRGHSVRGAQWKAVPLPAGCESVVVGNIDDATDWDDALRNVDVVVHLAARVHVMNEVAADPLLAFRSVNVGGTRGLAEAAAKAGVKRFVFMSSIKVNGEETGERDEGGKQRAEVGTGGDLSVEVLSGEDLSFKREKVLGGGDLSGSGRKDLSVKGEEGGGMVGAFSESDVPNPQDPYGVSKWEAEQVLRSIESSSTMEVTILRPPLIYGPGVKANFRKLMDAVKKGVPLPLGCVNNSRSLLGLTNLTSAVIACVEHPEAGGETFVLCDGEDVSSAELVRCMAGALGRRPRLVPVPLGLMRMAGVAFGKTAQVDRLFGSLVIDASKIRNMLAWQPPCDMATELMRLADSMR